MDWTVGRAEKEIGQFHYPITPKTKLDSNINAPPIMISFGAESKAEWETAIGLNGYCLNQKKSGAATEFQHA